MMLLLAYCIHKSTLYLVAIPCLATELYVTVYGDFDEHKSLYDSILEEGGTMFTFEGTAKKCSLKVVLKVHSPQFYWKVCALLLSFYNRCIISSGKILNIKKKVNKHCIFLIRMMA